MISSEGFGILLGRVSSARFCQSGFRVAAALSSPAVRQFADPAHRICELGEPRCRRPECSANQERTHRRRRGAVG